MLVTHHVGRTLRIFGTSREGGRALLGLMVPWCVFMALLFHDTPRGSEQYFVFSVPLLIASVYLARHLRHGRRVRKQAAD